MAAQPPFVAASDGAAILRMRATVRDLLSLTQTDDAHYELIGGILLRMPPPQEAHGQISSLLVEALAPYCRAHGIRAHLVTDIGYQLNVPGSAETVLAPDVSIFQVPKAANETYSQHPPLLAIEIASPSQSRLYLKDKAELFLLAGTPIVWVIWQDTHTVDVWTALNQMTTYTLQATLTGGTILPGLLCPVAAIFP